MRLKAILKLLEIEIKLFLREPPAVVFNLCFPALILLIFGAIFNFPSGVEDYKVIELYIPSIISITIASCGIMGIPIVIAEYKEEGVFKQYKTSPIAPLYILIVQFMVGFLMCLMGTILIIILGNLLFKVRIPKDIIFLFLSFGLSCASIFSFGFLISNFTKGIKSASGISMSIFFPMLFLSGAAIPKELFPDVMKKMANILPLSWVVDLLKDAWVGNKVEYHLVLLLILLLITALTISIYRFKWE